MRHIADNSKAIGLIFAALVLADGSWAQAAAQSGDGMISELVVTARKREESLLTVPVSVTAFRGVDLEERGLRNAEDLFAIVPGLYYSQRGQRTNDEQFYLTIRGIGSSPVVEPSVGVFVDGVYVPSLGWNTDFLELERIEILRGPQGALFGRNTQAGALNIITKDPSEEFEGKLLLEGAQFDSYKAQVYLSGPLADNVRASIAGFASTTDGFVNNVVRGEDQDDRERYGVRLKLVADITENIDVSLSGDYVSSEGRFNALGDADPLATFTIVDPNAAATGTFTESHALAGQDYTTFGDSEQTVDVENFGAGLTLNWDFGPAVLTSITGYRSVESVDSYDIDGIGANAINAATTEQSILSEELRLTSNIDGRFDYIIGLYGFSETLDQKRTLDAFFTPGAPNLLINLIGPMAPAMTRDFVDIDRKGFAIFGQATYDVTDKLNIAAGLRYSYENVKQTPFLSVRVLGGAVAFDNTTPQEDSFSGFSPMGSVKYQWTPEVMTYFTVSTGFKGGGFTKEVPNTPTQNAALDNETSLNLEAGVKAIVFDDRLQVSASLFRSKVKEMQLSTRINIGSSIAPIFAPATINAGEAVSQGAELEFTARPFGNLSIDGSIAFTDTEFDKFVAIPADTASGTVEYSRAGQPFPEVPEWTVSLRGQYVFSLTDLGLDVIPSVTYRYVDDKFIGDGTEAIPFVDISSYDVVDAQVSIVKDGLEFTIFAKNIFDEYYVVNKLLNQPILAVPGNRAYRKPGAPSQIGARLTVSF